MTLDAIRNLTIPQIKTTLQEKFGVNPPSGKRHEELVEILASEEGVTYVPLGQESEQERDKDDSENVTHVETHPVQSEPVVTASVSPVAPSPKKQKSKKKRLVIMKGATKIDMADVHLIVNGRPYQIKRGVEVTVPEEVVAALDDAKRRTYLPGKNDDNKLVMEEHIVHSYPFQDLGFVND